MPLTPNVSTADLDADLYHLGPADAGGIYLLGNRPSARPEGGPVLADWETQLQDAFQQTRTTFENIFNRAK